MKKLAVIFFFVFLLGIWFTASRSESHTSFWTCEMNAFFAAEPGRFFERRPSIDGQGLVSCKNVSGFDFDVPVKASIKLERETRSPASVIDSSQLHPKVTMYSSPFVVTRDVNSIYKLFKVQSADASVNSTQKAHRRPVVLISKDGMTIPVEISISTETLGPWRMTGLALSFDESAPTDVLTK